jgi:site-specific DNA recombinase
MSCKVTGGPPALGYKVDPVTQKYVINDWEAEAVKLIFSMYLDGHSYGEIITALNSKGYRTRRGQPFAKNSIYSILRNERYTGVYIYVKDTSKNPKGKYVRHGEYDPDAIVRIPGGIPAIISKEDFRRVQELMSERQYKAARFAAKQEYLLSGKIYCGECSSPYAGNSRKPRPGHPLYISYKCTKRNQRETCLNPEINRTKLEDIVLSRLSSVVFNPALIPELVTKFNDYVAEKTGSAQGKIEPLRSELRKVEHKIRVTVNLMIDTESDALKEKLHELEDTKAKLVYELSEAEAAVSQAGFSEEQVRQLFGQAEQQLKNATLANRRMVVDRFVDKVVMFPNRVEIYLNPIGDMTIKEVVEKA